MSNPIYHDDPDFYERPGETVHLTVDPHPMQMLVPALPWQEQPTLPSSAGLRAALVGETRAGTYTCVVCHRPTRSAEHLTCDYCARAQQRDETALARMRQPMPSRSRISIREGWETWASEQPHDTEDLDSGHVREYESRIG